MITKTVCHKCFYAFKYFLLKEKLLEKKNPYKIDPTENRYKG